MLFPLLLTLVVTTVAVSKGDKFCLPITRMTGLGTIDESEEEVNLSGPKGDQGPPGYAGICPCYRTQELKKAFERFNDTITRMTEEVRVLNETKRSYCHYDHICLNGGRCFSSKKEVACSCALGFFGPKCENETRCLISNLPLGVVVSTTSESVGYGEVITYRCRSGYRMVGIRGNRLNTTCRSDRTWSKPPPYCQVRHCNVGITDRRLTDQQMTASSSSRTSYLAPHYARLGIMPSSQKAWLPNRPYVEDEMWLQVDLRGLFAITGVKTNGYPGKYWGVTSFKIAYGNKPSGLRYILGTDEQQKIFHSVGKYNDPVTNMFYPPIVARIVRLYVHTWSLGPYLRLEYFTCYEL